MQILSPILNAILSILSISLFLGNKATTNEYPGRNNTKGNPTIALIGVVFKGGTVIIIVDCISWNFRCCVYNRYNISWFFCFKIYSL